MDKKQTAEFLKKAASPQLIRAAMDLGIPNPQNMCRGQIIGAIMRRELEYQRKLENHFRH